ncbi:shikimate kinase [Ferruginibacter albus]|uniref:shikimate kinase n=1 Tax=Ferruginibacter albus TaxID=2875540 RepID=UPI001CC358A3|nr:shikimate kinase [Ferruginibacter albus]UAY52919.1 shikimate kinase [Ferruginibacter albus]
MQIFLIGFMGSGKTYWGDLWSRSGEFAFVDLDELIESKEKKTISKIFEEKGEQYFRELEAATLRSVTDKKDIIISCGGGTPCFHDNMQWMNAHGVTVYLKASPQHLAKRLMKERQKRPVLSGLNDDELVNFIDQKVKERESFYSRAKIILNVEEMKDKEMPEAIRSI